MFSVLQSCMLADIPILMILANDFWWRSSQISNGCFHGDNILFEWSFDKKSSMLTTARTYQCIFLAVFCWCKLKCYFNMPNKLQPCLTISYQQQDNSSTFKHSSWIILLNYMFLLTHFMPNTSFCFLQFLLTFLHKSSHLLTTKFIWLFKSEMWTDDCINRISECKLHNNKWQYYKRITCGL